MIIPLTPEARPNSRPSGILKEGSEGVTRLEVSIVTVLGAGTSVPLTDTKRRAEPARRESGRSLATHHGLSYPSTHA